MRLKIKVLDRLFLKGFIGPYLLSFFIVEFVLVMQHLWRIIDDILGKGYSIWDYFELLFYLSVSIIPMALPLTVLLSSVMTYGEMAEKHELTAIKSSGVSLYRILKPGLVIACLTMFFSFYASNILKPHANERFIKKMRDMKTNQLTFVFDEKVYNKEFDNYSIWIDKKDNDGRSIDGIRIYDHTDADKSIVNMTYASHGEMYTTADQKYLIMELVNGYSFKEIRSESADANRKSFHAAGRPLSRVYFKKMQKVFKLSELLNLNMNSSSHKKHDMMNSLELYQFHDSLNLETHDIRIDATFDFNNMVKNFKIEKKDAQSNKDKSDNSVANLSAKQKAKNEKQRTKYKQVVKRRQDLIMPDLILDIDPDSSLIEMLVQKERKIVLDKATKGAMAHRDRFFNKGNEIRIKKSSMTLAMLRLHQQFSWAIVCLLFLFIGGPAGAIVRKGGFGFPLLIAIFFYMIFIMTSITGEKLLSSRALGAVSSAWLPCIILLPFAIYLSYMALNDKNVNGLGLIEKFNKLISKSK